MSISLKFRFLKVVYRFEMASLRFRKFPLKNKSRVNLRIFSERSKDQEVTRTDCICFRKNRAA